MRHHQTKDLHDKDIMVSYSSVPFKEKCYLFTNTAREEVCVTFEPRLSGLVGTSLKSPDNRESG